MKSAADCLFGRRLRAKRLALPMLVLGAVAGAGLGWVTTAGFHSNLAATPAAGDPTSTGSPASASKPVGRPGPNDDIVASDAAPEQTKGAWLERWWMDVQESVKTPRIDSSLQPWVWEKGSTMQEHILTGRIAGLVIFRVAEFGTRASFTIEGTGRCPVVCAVEGDVAREFIARYCDGDKVAVRGRYEPRPSTAAAHTPWVTRFRVRAVRVAEHARLAA